MTYELAGSPRPVVYVRAFPIVAGRAPEAGLTLDGVLEATGPTGDRHGAVGCLGSGMTYTITIDAVGDDRGVLASATVAVP